MDQSDRTEVREIIHGIVGGYHAKVDAQNLVTNSALGDIKEQLNKLNGTVASNKEMIDQNLPHTIANCVQTKTIKEIRDNMVGRKAIITAIIIAIPLAAAAVGLVVELVK